MTIDEEAPLSMANKGPTSGYSKRFDEFVTITPTEDSSSSFIVPADRWCDSRSCQYVVMAKPLNHDVHDAEFASLNAKFYRGSPHAYFERRLKSLAVAIGDGRELDALLEAGVSYGDFSLKSDDNDVEQGHSDQKDIDAYAAVESAVLLHHTAEATLRLYLAHANRNPCPWLEVAKLTNFREFKQRIAALAGSMDDDEVLDDLAEVFSYRSTPEFLVGGDPTAMWKDHRAGLRDLISESIRTILDDAHIYNAAKHGMAIVSSDLGVSIGDSDDSDPLIHQKGPVLTFLELNQVSDSEKYWHQTSAWVDPTKSMAITFLLIRLMDSLWRSAKAHFCIETATTLPYLLKSNQVSDLLRMHVKDGFNLSRMSERLHPQDTSSERF